MSTIERKHSTPRMSKIVVHGDLIFLCGQTAGGTDITDTAGQTAECLHRVDTLLAEAGSDKSRILSALINIRSMDDFAAMNAVWDAWVPAGHTPPRATVQAKLARPDWRIEIVATAAVA